MNTATKTPTFSIYKSPNSKETVDTLEHCFFTRTKINTDDPPAILKGADGFVYTAVYDCRLPAEPMEIDVIISFQQHTYGRFAVIRLARSSK